jgi:hypothetical protein
MAKSKKPYPGAGAFVVLLDYGGVWVLHCGAATLERAQERRRKLNQWPDDRVRIVPNLNPEGGQA